jgi:multiple sugar transport system ATP-binding protein
MATIELRNVKKSFGSQQIIRGVDLQIADREFVAFVGPSGSGKSTLLRMIAGLEEVSEGALLIDGIPVEHVPPAKRGLAMVFQSYALYPHMTVAENMGFNLRLAGVPKSERDEKVRVVARVLEMEALLQRKPRQLSGGQMQRVAIGRAMTRQPKAFLLDEPLSNLDAGLQAQMRLELVRLHQELKTTMIYVTHDQLEAMTMADRIVVLNQGRIEQSGTPLELYHHPATMFVAGFIGAPKMNFLDATVASVTPTEVTLSLSAGGSLAVPVPQGKVTEGENVTLGVRPEDVVIAPYGEFAGQVEIVEHLGAWVFLHVKIGSGTKLVAVAPGDCQSKAGDCLTLGVLRQRVHLFDDSGNAIKALAPRGAM